MWVCLWVCGWVGAWVGAYVCVCVRACVRACVCACVRACVGLCGGVDGWVWGGVDGWVCVGVRGRGRSLQLMVRELHEHEVGIGRCTMLGARDLCRLSQRCSKGGMHCEALEQDMVDMFWALRKDEVLKAFEWGASRLRHRLRSAQTFFGLSKDGEKSFDNIGKSTDKMFLVTTIDMLRRFVKYDIRDNNLFLLDQIVLQQGSSGVPIGGFLSAQLAELWALWKEVLTLGGASTRCHLPAPTSQAHSNCLNHSS